MAILLANCSMDQEKREHSGCTSLCCHILFISYPFISSTKVETMIPDPLLLSFPTGKAGLVLTECMWKKKDRFSTCFCRGQWYIMGKASCRA